LINYLPVLTLVAMDESTKQSKLNNRLDINPTDYAIKTFTP